MKSDIFALLKKSRLPEPGQTKLPVISTWTPATHQVIFFTFQHEIFCSHYLEGERTYIRCLSDTCPACDAGIKATEHLYLPVWDAKHQQIAVLKLVTSDNGPTPKILEFLETYGEQLTDIVAAIVCVGKGIFTITAHKLLPETNRGALACEAFGKGLESGAIKLQDCVKAMSAEEMRKLPTIARSFHAVVGDPLAPPSRMLANKSVGDVVQPSGKEGA